MVTIFFRWSDRNFSSLGIFGWWLDLSDFLKAAVIIGPIIFLVIIITCCCCCCGCCGNCCRSSPSTAGPVIVTPGAPAVMATNVKSTVPMRRLVEEAWIRRFVHLLLFTVYCFLEDFIHNGEVVVIENVEHCNSFSRWRPAFREGFHFWKYLNSNGPFGSCVGYWIEYIICGLLCFELAFLISSFFISSVSFGDLLHEVEAVSFLKLFSVRAVFNWVSKVISELLWFCITSLSDSFKVLALLFQPIKSETKTNSGSRVHIFPRFVSATCNYVEFWLVKVIPLILVLRHAIETRTIFSPNFLGPIYTIRFCRMRQAHDRPTTWLTIVAAF